MKLKELQDMNYEQRTKNKEMQIEEMAEDLENTILGLGIHLCEKSAEKLYDLGYRKLPDGATVLLVGKYNQALDGKTIEYFIKHNEQIRKETAREILNEILFVESVEGWEENEQLVKFSNKIVDKIEELANKYGVEAHDDGTRTN